MERNNDGKYICEGCTIKMNYIGGLTEANILFKPVIKYGSEWYIIDTPISIHKEEILVHSFTREEAEKKTEDILSSVKLVDTPS